jgi:hypothetical protein
MSTTVHIGDIDGPYCGVEGALFGWAKANVSTEPPTEAPPATPEPPAAETKPEDEHPGIEVCPDCVANLQLLVAVELMYVAGPFTAAQYLARVSAPGGRHGR